MVKRYVCPKNTKENEKGRLVKYTDYRRVKLTLDVCEKHIEQLVEVKSKLVAMKWTAESEIAHYKAIAADNRAEIAKLREVLKRKIESYE